MRFCAPRTFAIICFAVAPSRQLAAQTVDTLQAARGGVAAFHLDTGTFVEQVSMLADGVSRAGPRSTREVRLAKCDDQPCYAIVLSTPGARGTALDSVWLAARSLVLIRHVEDGLGSHAEMNVSGGHVAGVVTDSGRSRTFDATAPVFDFSIATEIVNQLPLRAGYHAWLNTLDVAGMAKPIAVQVLGVEDVDTPSGKRAAWVVEVDLGSHKAIRWVDQSTRHGLQWKVDLGGGRVMWGHTLANGSVE